MKLPVDLPLVVVQWADATASAVEMVVEANRSDLHQPAMMYSLGWVLWQDEAGLTIVSEACPADSEWRGRTFIPAGLVQAIIPLSVARRKTGAPAPPAAPARSDPPTDSSPGSADP